MMREKIDAMMQLFLFFDRTADRLQTGGGRRAGIGGSPCAHPSDPDQKRKRRRLPDLFLGHDERMSFGQGVDVEKCVVIRIFGDFVRRHIHLIPIKSESDVDFRREKLFLTPEEFQAIAAKLNR